MVDHKCASCHTHSAAQMCNNTSCISGVVSPSPAPVLPYLDPSIHLCLQIIITMCEPSVVGQTSNERYLPNGFGETLPSAERLSEKSVMRLSQQMLLEGGRGGGRGGGRRSSLHSSSRLPALTFPIHAHLLGLVLSSILLVLSCPLSFPPLA